MLRWCVVSVSYRKYIDNKIYLMLYEYVMNIENCPIFSLISFINNIKILFTQHTFHSNLYNIPHKIWLAPLVKSVQQSKLEFSIENKFILTKLLISFLILPVHLNESNIFSLFVSLLLSISRSAPVYLSLSLSLVGWHLCALASPF